MDAVVVLILALVALIRVTAGEQEAPAVTHNIQEANVSEAGQPAVREAKTNETYFKDETAFSSIINALGFPKEKL